MDAPRAVTTIEDVDKKSGDDCSYRREATHSPQYQRGHHGVADGETEEGVLSVTIATQVLQSALGYGAGDQDKNVKEGGWGGSWM